MNLNYLKRTCFDSRVLMRILVVEVKDEQVYDVICLDIMIPKVDGVKVLQAICDFKRIYLTIFLKHGNISLVSK